MTQEKKCFVRPLDISAVRIRCVNCGGASIIPITKLANRDKMAFVIGRQCQHCDVESGFRLHTAELEGVVSFAEQLGKLADFLRGRNIEMSLQVECLEGE
jgi:hypothetical protein